MKKLMNNKKGAIFNLFSGAGDLVKSFFELLPKPIKFLLFLAILLLLGVIIGWLLNGLGVFCDSADNPVKISNILVSLDLLNEIPDPTTLNLEVIESDTAQYMTVEECSVCYEAGQVLIIRELPNGSTYKQNISRRTCFYKDAGCVICEETIGLDPQTANLLGNLKGYCLGDATIKPYEDKNMLSKWFCGKTFIGRCQPPEHYFYDSTRDNYFCLDETCTGITAGVRWDEKLRDSGAKMIYPEGQLNKKDADSMVQVSCKDIKPTITIYGIPIFDYRMWLIIMLITILAGFYIKYKKA